MKNLTMAIAQPMAASFLLVLSYLSQAEAATFSFTSSTDFFDTLELSPRFTETFEGLPANTIISPGTNLNGITYQSFNGVSAGRIDNSFSRFGDSSLAAERDTNLATPDFFQGNSGFSVAFDSPVYAVGIFFNSNPTSSNSDFYLETPVGISTTGGGSSNYDINTFFFAGLVSDTPFTTASFGSRNPQVGYNVDNLTYTNAPTTIPEPTTVVGSLIASGVVAFKNRRRKRSQNNSNK